MKELIDWTQNHIKHKDLILKKPEKVDDKGTSINLHYKEKIQHYEIMKDLDLKIKPDEKNHYTVVCENSELNFSKLIKNWTEISKVKNLTIFFVNTKTGEKWHINPHIHNMIADPASLENGLKTMYDTANGKIVEIKKSKKKPQIFEENSSEEDSEEEN